MSHNVTCEQLALALCLTTRAAGCVHKRKNAHVPSVCWLSRQVLAMADGVHPGALVPGASSLTQQLRQYIQPEPGRCAAAL